MNDDKADKAPLDDREVKAIAQRLRNDVVLRLKPLGSAGGWEIAERAAQLVEWQLEWIAELEELVLGFDRAGLHAQPTAGEPALESIRDQTAS